MASNWGTVIVCPFYRSEGDLSICCEGFASECVRQQFSSRCNKRIYRNRFCEGMTYQSCPIAQLTAAKYR